MRLPGRVSLALPAVLCGADDVARIFVGVISRYHEDGVAIRTRLQRFNGSLGILVFEDGQLATALAIEAHSGRIRRIYAIRNPNKFSAFAR